MPCIYINMLIQEKKMAYDYFPKDAKELLANPNKVQTLIKRELLDDVAAILEHLNEEYKGLEYEQPIAIDPTPKNNTKLKIRKTFVGKLATQMDSNPQTQINIRQALSRIKRPDGKPIKVNDLGFSFGDGSRGNKGVNNRGLGFEDDVVASFELWKQGEPYEAGAIIKPNIEKFILELVDYYDLTKYSEIKIVPEGALNKARPLNITSAGMYVGGSPVFDIGKTVTDVTVQGRNPRGAVDKTVYLSLKKGSTVSYFNAGLGQGMLRGYPAQQATGDYKHSSDFLTFCKHFGIDLEMFDACFRYKTAPKSPIGEEQPSNYNPRAIGQLIESAIGYGFHMVHLFDTGAKNIKHYEASQQYMKRNGTLRGKPTIYYGGASRFSRSVRIQVQTHDYRKIDFVIRNKTNAALPPKDLLSNFYYA